MSQNPAAPSPVPGWMEKLTLEEKALLMGGAEMWRTRAVPRLGIPPLQVSDGPTGVRGSGLSGGATAACFPCGSALAATWNPELVARRRGSPVKPATRSASAEAKARGKRTPDGEPVHRFRGLLDHLATLTKNTIAPAGDLPSFEQLLSPRRSRRRPSTCSASRRPCSQSAHRQTPRLLRNDGDLCADGIRASG